MTVSIGVAIAQPEGEEEPRDAFRRADAALYEAKRAGGNRVIADRGGEPPHAIPEGAILPMSPDCYEASCISSKPERRVRWIWRSIGRNAVAMLRRLLTLSL